MNLNQKEVYPGFFNESGEHLRDTIAFAKKVNLLESFDKAMDSLRRKTKNGYVVTLYKDFAPYSFYFEVFKDNQFAGNGGVIFHGHHDGFGSGSHPTFSVTLTPTSGWSIHT